MELKTIDDFDKFEGETVYLVDDSICYDNNGLNPFIKDWVNDFKLENIGWNRTEHPYKYTYRLYIPHLKTNEDFLYTFGIDEDNGFNSEHKHIFSNSNEALAFIKLRRLLLNGEITKIKQELKKCTVNREQIAEKFGIPIDKLIIV